MQTYGVEWNKLPNLKYDYYHIITKTLNHKILKKFSIYLSTDTDTKTLTTQITILSLRPWLQQLTLQYWFWHQDFNNTYYETGCETETSRAQIKIPNLRPRLQQLELQYWIWYQDFLNSNYNILPRPRLVKLRLWYWI